MTLPAELAEPPLLYPCAVIFAPDLTVTVTLSAEAPLIPWEVPVTFQFAELSTRTVSFKNTGKVEVRDPLMS